MPARALPPVDVLVVGTNTIDLVYVTDGGPVADAKVAARSLTRHPGGQAANVAFTLALLGLRVRFVGAFADDPLAAAGPASLTAAGCLIDGCRTVPDCPPHTSAIVVDEPTGSRTLVEYKDRRLELPVDAVDPDWLDGARALYCDGSELAAQAVAASAARERGVPVFADLETASPESLRFVRLVDELAAPLAIVEELTGAAGAVAVQAVHAVGPAVAIATDGARGCRVTTASGSFAVPAAPARAVDTTGAGDAFHAGYVAARMTGLDVRPSIELGTRLAARKCGVPGPRLGADDAAPFGEELASALTADPPARA